MQQTLKNDGMRDWEGKITSSVLMRLDFGKAVGIPEDTLPAQASHLDLKENPEDARLRDQSGERIDNIMIRGYAQHNSIQGGEEEETEEKRAEKKIREMVFDRILEKTIYFGDTAITLNDIHKYVGKDIENEKGFQNIASKMMAVSEDKMLRDKNGKVVQTIEEKRAMEELDKDCKMFLSQDEVTMHNNQLVTVQGLNWYTQSQEAIDRKQGLLKQLDKGEIDLEDLPDDIKKDVADSINGIEKPPQTGILGLLDRTGPIQGIAPPATPTNDTLVYKNSAPAPVAP